MNEIILKKFNENQLQIVQDDLGNPWFVAKDVMNVLGIKSQAHALRKVDPDDKGEAELQGESDFLRKHAIVSEAGLYTLIMQSNKESAKKFQKWVTTEVLPSIRKTGSYVARTIDPLDQLKMHVAVMEKQRDEIRLLNSSLEKVAIEAKQEGDTLTSDQIAILDEYIEDRASQVSKDDKSEKVNIGCMRGLIKKTFFKIAGSRTYKEIARRDFEKALELVMRYKPGDYKK